MAFPFVARGATKPALHLGLIADPQYADIPPLATRHYRESIWKLGEAIEHFNGLELDFCVNAGDTVDRDWASFDAVLKAIGKCRHKFHYVLGNHDFDFADEYKARVDQRLGMPGRYFSVNHGGFRLVMLDTNDLSVYAYAKGSAGQEAGIKELERMASLMLPQAQPWNGAVGAKQMAWLKDTCKAAAAANEKVIIFSHHPILPAWHNHNTWNSAELLAVVEKNPAIVAWINGHNHAGAYAEKFGVPFITLRGMVETAAKNSFSTARLFADRMELTGHGREISREIPFRQA